MNQFLCTIYILIKLFDRSMNNQQKRKDSHGTDFGKPKKKQRDIKKMCNDFIHVSQITAMLVSDIGRDNTV